MQDWGVISNNTLTFGSFFLIHSAYSTLRFLDHEYIWEAVADLKKASVPQIAFAQLLPFYPSVEYIAVLLGFISSQDTLEK